MSRTTQNRLEGKGKDLITCLKRKRITEGSTTFHQHVRLRFLMIKLNFPSRKLKNREAAQTARDKKKARMDELEELVRELQSEVN